MLKCYVNNIMFTKYTKAECVTENSQIDPHMVSKSEIAAISWYEVPFPAQRLFFEEKSSNFSAKTHFRDFAIIIYVTAYDLP